MEPEATSDAQDAAETLRWRSLPVVDDFPRSALLIGVVVAVCVGVHVSFGGLGYALLAAAFLAVALGRYFLPTWYELDGDGVAVRFLGRTRRVAWSEVRRTQVHREGMQLSPFEQPSRLESFRGTFLRFAGNRDEVVSFVESQVAAHR